MGPGDGAARSSSPSQESKCTNQSWEVCAGSLGAFPSRKGLMAFAYVDSSSIIAIAFGEHSADDIARRLREQEDLRSSNLLEAEVRAAHIRTGIPFDPESLARIRWITPDRGLSHEISVAARAGYLRGADLWHLATALYLTPDPGEVTFITLDERQEEVASTLGFRV